MNAVHSTSFPPNVPQQEHSPVHKFLREATSIESEIVLRPIQQTDISKLKELNSQWFPVAYGQPFYDKLAQGASRCWIAQCAIVNRHGKRKQIIVGAIIYEYTPVDGSILAKESWTEYLSNTYSAIYIMTLGVIDEFRGKGVASQLLNKVMQEANSNPLIRYVSLHVVIYNSACRFYERNSFERIAQLEAYYRIFGTEYDAICYVKFVNGGRRRQGWFEWFKNLLG